MKFSQNNRYHFSIRMAPYEVPYIRRYRTPLSWQDIDELLKDIDELLTIRPELIQVSIEQVRIIHE